MRQGIQKAVKRFGFGHGAMLGKVASVNQNIAFRDIQMFMLAVCIADYYKFHVGRIDDEWGED